MSGKRSSRVLEEDSGVQGTLQAPNFLILRVTIVLSAVGNHLIEGTGYKSLSDGGYLMTQLASSAEKRPEQLTLYVG